MEYPRNTRGTLDALATSSTDVICTVGMPAFSSSLVIVDPQRVLVPQVEVKIAAATPDFNIS